MHLSPLVASLEKKKKVYPLITLGLGTFTLICEQNFRLVVLTFGKYDHFINSKSVKNLNFYICSKHFMTHT